MERLAVQEHTYLCLGVVLNNAARSAVELPDLKIVTAGVLGRNGNQLQFTSQFVVLGQLCLLLK